MWNLGNFDIQRIAGDLGVVPVNGKGDGRVAEDAEVECIVSVLPDVLATDDDIFADCLLKTGVEFIAVTGVECSGAGRAGEERGEDGVGAAGARKDEVLVEGSFERAGVGDAQHCCGGLDVVCDANARIPCFRCLEKWSRARSNYPDS